MKIDGLNLMRPVLAGLCSLFAWPGVAHALAPTAAGAVDPTFGTGGVVITNPSTRTDQLAFGALQADGELVGAGGVQQPNLSFAFGVVRYLDSGALDPTFASDGVGTYAFDSSSFGESTLIAPNGRIYVIGSVQLSGVTRCAVLRLLSSGQIDNTFGVNGISRLSPPSGTPNGISRLSPPSGTPNGISRLSPPSGAPYCNRGGLQADGKILVSGYTDTSAFVARLHTDGTLDLPFGSGQGFAFVQGAAMAVYNMTLGPSGRIALFGTAAASGQPGVTAVMTAGGSMDATFNGNGIYRNGTLFGENVLDGKFLADGRLVVTGNSPNAKPAAWRFNVNGTPDTTFGTGGMAERMIPPVTGGWGRSIVIQPDGKYVIGIRSLVGNNVRYTVLRLTDSGAADTSFGTAGQTLVETSNAQGDYIFGTELGADGKIWLTGIGAATAGDQAYMVARVIGTETTTNVIEFYNSIISHYFITADPNEAAAVDAGAAGAGWARTGKTFKSGGPSRVCRFYGSPDISPATGTRRGPNGHFYTIDSAECAAVKQDAGWRFESYDFSGWPKSGAACPAGTVAVLRTYNNRFAQNDSNHRYTTEPATYSAMLAQGWVGEGAVFCAVL